MGGIVRSVFGGRSPAPAPAAVDYDAINRKAREDAEAPSEAKGALLKNKKKGRYATLLTGGKGVLGDTEVGTKSLLGS
jgi:hypothetical protein